MSEVINNIIYLIILNGHSKNEVDDSCFPILAARKTIVFSEQKAKTFFSSRWERGECTSD